MPAVAGPPLPRQSRPCAFPSRPARAWRSVLRQIAASRPSIGRRLPIGDDCCQQRAGLAMTGHSCLSDLSERESAFMSETTPVLLGMSGSLRTGSYSNAILATLREKFAGRADLQLYDLAPIPLYNQDFEGDKRPPMVKKLLADLK